MHRAVAMAAALALLAGCGGDDDGGGDPSTSDVDIEFAEKFEGAFPGSDWTVTEGVPFTDDKRGNDAPGLVLGVMARSHVRSAFTFSTAEPLRLRFDIATPGRRTESDSRFKFVIKAENGIEEASFEVRLKDAEIEFKILGESGTFDFFTDAGYRTVTFTFDQGLASWSVDGDPFLTLEQGFPGDEAFRIEMESAAGLTAGFEVDNIVIERDARGRQ